MKVSRSLFTVIIVILAILICGCQSKQIEEVVADYRVSDPYKSPVNCRLMVTSKGVSGALTAEITFTNQSNQAVLIEQRNLLRGNTMTLDAFEVIYEGIHLPYLGVSIKRSPSTKPEDFHLLPPRASFKSSVLLNNFYGISKPGRYSIKYRAYNCWCMEKDGCLFLIESNTATHIRY